MDIVIIGAGGMGREALDIIDAVNRMTQTYRFCGFIVDEQFGAAGTAVNEDGRIVGDYAWLERHQDTVHAVCAVGSPVDRKSLVERARGMGVRFCRLVHPQSVISKSVSIGEGSIVMAGCILTNQIRMGDHVIINAGCTISHDADIADYATLSPGVHIAGKVTVGEGSFLGIGANIIENMTIGAWSVIGAGSTVLKDIPERATAVGAPARVIKRHADGCRKGTYFKGDKGA